MRQSRLRLERAPQRLRGDLALEHNGVIDQDDRDAPVVEAKELVIGVDVNDLGLDVELMKEAERLLTQVAAGSGDQDDPHGRSLRRGIALEG